MQSNTDLLKIAAEILEKKSPTLDADELKRFVQSYLDRREVFLAAAETNGSPLYIIDRETLIDRLHTFATEFFDQLNNVEMFYAVKSNNHPDLVKMVVKEKYGLDVSSGTELQLAIEANAQKIIFSGPGKTDDELALAAQHADKVTILIDSFGELVRLDRAVHKAGVNIRAGIRLTTDENGLWRKFGIPLSELEHFFAEADRFNQIDLAGLQFHTSWNLNPVHQTAFIERLGQEIKRLSETRRARIRFIDIGGGYWPPQGEWLQSAGTPEGNLARVLSNNNTPTTHYRLPAAAIDEFAHAIARALKKNIFKFLDCTIYLEPGRWICNDAMHILLQVVDKKADDLIITDAGTNSIGWERFETDYFPVINLSRPGLDEHGAYVLGSLCTPHDVWGYSFFGGGIEPCDYLLIPTQGAYTYSLRQNFIKPLPDSVIV